MQETGAINVDETMRNEAREQAREFLGRHPLHLKNKYGGDLESAAEAIVNEQLGMPREPRRGRRDASKQGEDAIDPTEKFEEGSMFNPGFGEDEKAEMGGTDRVRDFNERLYNLRHLESTIDLSTVPSADMEFMREMAERVTDYRREQFNEVRLTEFAKPKDERVPHYIDKDGRLAPFPPELIEANKRARQWPIPPAEPTYEEHKAGKNKSDAKEDPLPALGEYDFPNFDVKLYTKPFDGTNASMPPPLPNVLNLSAEEAIRPLRVSEILEAELRGESVPGLFNGSHGPMSSYAEAFLDEQALASHDFRKDNLGGKSLAQFTGADEQKHANIDDALEEDELAEKLAELARAVQARRKVP